MTHALRLQTAKPLTAASMVLAFTGWMDGGEVSTGTVHRLIDHLNAEPIGEIDPADFYIYNFPGAMEIAAVFRPHVKIESGLIRAFELPTNTFHVAPRENLVLFVGKEPNLNWSAFGDCIFEAAARTGVERIVFVGSFGGSVPHTREPRLYASVTDPDLKPTLKSCGVRFSEYEGPASFITYLMTQAGRRGCRMISLAAEIPSYLEGANPLCIEAVSRRLAAILGLQMPLTELRGVSNECESRVSAAVAKDAKLAKRIRKLEEEYDDELIDRAEEA
jgi:proteasome assembly chaperone (PAC2) family protein